MNNPAPATSETANSREINVHQLATDTSAVGAGLCSLGELIRNSHEMEVDDWGLTLVGIGHLVEVLGQYTLDLSERGHAIDRNIKAMEEGRHV